MAGKITITSSGIPGGSDKQVQFNDGGIFGGAAQLFWDKANDRLGINDSTPARQLSLTKSIELLATTASDIGVIYKGNDRFVHDYAHATANGNNLFMGAEAGNFSMNPGGGNAFLASDNVALGTQALKTLTTGYNNIAIGYRCLFAATTANKNVGIGKNSLYQVTTGTANMAIGYESLYYGTNNSSNVAIGYCAGKGVTGHNKLYNTLIGYKAGYLLESGGDRNILLGYQAGDNITSGEKNVVIGYDLNALSATADYQLNIGSLIFGDLGATKKVGLNTSVLNETLNVGGAIRLGTSALTNAGTIRWTGADFEGYTGAAWESLTPPAGLWTDEGTYYYPNNTSNFKLYDTGQLSLARTTSGRLTLKVLGSAGSPVSMTVPTETLQSYVNTGVASEVSGDSVEFYVRAGSGGMHIAQRNMADIPSAGSWSTSGFCGVVGTASYAYSAKGGYIFGSNPYAKVTTAAASKCIGEEVNTDVRVTVGERHGIQITDVTESTVRGTTRDSMLYLTNQGSAMTFDQGIRIDAGGGQFPTRTNLIKALDGTISNAGIDISGMSITNGVAMVVPDNTGIRWGDETADEPRISNEVSVTILSLLGGGSAGSRICSVHDKLGIGNVAPGTHALNVTGTGLFTGTVTASCGVLTCDYVFEDGYGLLPINCLAKYVKREKKLPKMTINKGGSYSMATLREELVEKVEEQTLYILQLHERIKVLETK